MQGSAAGLCQFLAHDLTQTGDEPLAIEEGRMGHECVRRQIQFDQTVHGGRNRPGLRFVKEGARLTVSKRVEESAPA